MNLEIWKDIPNYEGLYQISSYGRVKSFYKKERILKPSIQHFKYKSKNYKREKIELSKNNIRKSFKIHRLVAQTFIPNPDNKPQVNHIDGNPLNNNVNNLEWCTNQENIIHSYKYLRTKKYNEKEIIDEYKNNINPSVICKKHNISRSTYSYILNKHNLKCQGNNFWRNKYHIDLKELKKDIDKGMSNKELVKKYNCSNDIIATRKYQFKKGMMNYE